MRNAAIFQDVTERQMHQYQPANTGGKQERSIRMAPNSTVFHRRKLKHHFAKIKVVAHLAAKNLRWMVSP